MGTEVVLHTPQWHGNTITVNGMRTGVVDRLPPSRVVVDMVSDNLGNWLFHCDIRHITEGMFTPLPSGRLNQVLSGPRPKMDVGVRGHIQ